VNTALPADALALAPPVEEDELEDDAPDEGDAVPEEAAPGWPDAAFPPPGTEL
jgi:hypothetical protein